MNRPFVALAAVALLCGASVFEALASEAGGEAAEHPAPEPYSFSFSSESVGGLATREEKGDANGRVTGFYMMMGEDGRERRVDYVADENGYRATISTNEVGTRSENSADAQYNARLPSEQQLAQAKISADDYRYLEEAHLVERERHLAQVNQNTQLQQQQQQGNHYVGEQGRPARPQQQNSNRLQSVALSQQIGQQPLGGNSGGSNNNIEYQRNSNNNLLPMTSPGPTTIQYDDNQDWRFRSSNNSQTPSWSQSGNFQLKQQAVERAPARLENQAQQTPVWQSNYSSSGSQGAGGIQRQLAQQFMQQASALNSQDYPRQREPQTRLQFESGQQTATQGALNDYSQTSQQQSNIIEELPNPPEPTTTPDQADLEVQTQSPLVQVQEQDQASVDLDRQKQQVAGTQVSSPRPSIAAVSSTPGTTTTTTTTTTTSTTPQPTPSGFVAINLKETSEQAQQIEAGQQTGDEQVEESPREHVQIVQRPQQQQQAQNVYSEAVVQTPQRPNSIKQVIENLQRPSAQLEFQQQLRVKPTAAPAFRPTLVPSAQPNVPYAQTSSAPEYPRPPTTVGTSFVPTTEATFETTRAPPRLAELLTTTTTTARPSARPVEPAYQAPFVPPGKPGKRPNGGAIKGQPAPSGRNYTGAASAANQWQALRLQMQQLSTSSPAKAKLPESTVATVTASSSSRAEPPAEAPLTELGRQVAVVPIVPYQKPQGNSISSSGYMQQTGGQLQPTRTTQQTLSSSTATPIQTVSDLREVAKPQQQQSQWKGVKGGSKQQGAQVRQFWKQQPQLQQQQQQKQQQSARQQTGVDYATSANFGSRIQSG